MIVQIARSELIFLEHLIGNNGLQQGQIGFNTAYGKIFESALGTNHRILVIRTGRIADQFRQQRVVVWVRRITQVTVGIGAQPRARRHRKLGQPPAGGFELTTGCDGLGIHPKLDGIAARGRHRRLIQIQIGQGRSGSNLQLSTHQIHTGDFLGHGMLDLQARIRFNEVVLASALIQQKLNGTETAILDGLGQFDRVLAQRLTRLRVQCRTGGNFNQLLMTPLHTAFAFA